MTLAVMTEKQQRIMVIYNDLDVLELLNEGLKLGGYDTIIAVDEEEALSTLDKMKPDMIVMDTVTADAHSLHIIDEVKNRTNVPIVVVTPDNELKTLKDMYEHGVDDIVYKPLNMRIFNARIGAILRRWYHFHKNLIIPPN